MNNLEEAKQKLEETRKLEAIMGVSQPIAKIPKSRMPRQKDIQIIEELLEKKIKDKKWEIKNEMLKKANKRWDTEINRIHAKAANLKLEIEQLAEEIKLESKETATIDMEKYGTYWEKLPESVKKAKENNEIIEISDDYENPEIERMKNKIETFIVNVRIGRDQLSNVQTLIDEINLIS